MECCIFVGFFTCITPYGFIVIERLRSQQNGQRERKNVISITVMGINIVDNQPFIRLFKFFRGCNKRTIFCKRSQNISEENNIVKEYFRIPFACIIRTQDRVIYDILLLWIFVKSIQTLSDILENREERTNFRRFQQAEVAILFHLLVFFSPVILRIFKRGFNSFLETVFLIQFLDQVQNQGSIRLQHMFRSNHIIGNSVNFTQSFEIAHKAVVEIKSREMFDFRIFNFFLNFVYIHAIFHTRFQIKSPLIEHNGSQIL